MNRNMGEKFFRHLPIVFVLLTLIMFGGWGFWYPEANTLCRHIPEPCVSMFVDLGQAVKQLVNARLVEQSGAPDSNGAIFLRLVINPVIHAISTLLSTTLTLIRKRNRN